MVAVVACNTLVGPLDWFKYKNAKGNVWACKACGEHWKRKMCGCRVLRCATLSGLTFMIYMDEPPSALLDKWKKERIEYYKRFEPTGPLLNTGIVLPMGFKFSSVITLDGAASTALWTAILLNPSVDVINGLHAEWLGDNVEEGQTAH